MFAFSIVLGLIILFIVSQILKVFDLKGSLAALVVGLIIVFFGSLQWLILLLIFAVVSHFATKAMFDMKKARKLQEGEHGERSTSNVLYAGIIGLAIACINFAHTLLNSAPFGYFELFAISFSVINSDTFASELGVVDKNVYMITTFKRTTPGVNGGVSLTGEAAAFFGALIIGVSYSILAFGTLRIVPIVFVTGMGFLGCQIDSILGALFENEGKMSKGQVNFFSAFVSVVVSALVLL
ncbi:DUF92 domain-containing protein [Oxyplasma meridianum]|uniref:DUF92 domain-containing protein n=1 Tax=Oxyplasma meridianum TaxID=3073602 RepID=A0AAX4NG78_9ARCH